MIPVVRQRSGKVPPRNEREESNPERSKGGGYCRKTPNRQTHRTAPQTWWDTAFWRLAAAVCHFQGRKRQLRADPPRDLKQALRMRTPQSSWYTGLLRSPDKASLRFSQLRSVSIQIPSSLAASVGCRPCSVTKRAAPALNSSSYRGGGVPFLAFFSSIFFAPFLSTLRLVSLSVNMAMGH